MLKIKEDKLIHFSTNSSLGGDLSVKELDYLYEYAFDDKHELNTGMVEFLLQLKKSEDGLIEIDEKIMSSRSNFKSIVFRSLDSGNIQKIGIFSINNFLLESWISWIGLSVALFKPIGVVIPVSKIAKSCWDNFKRLSRPQDSDSIDIIESVLKIKAKNKAKNLKANPTTKELKRNLQAMDSSRFNSAIEKLVELHAIEVSQWGDQAPDILHPNNQWKIKL